MWNTQARSTRINWIRMSLHPEEATTMFIHTVRRPLWPMIIGILLVLAIGENAGSFAATVETGRAAVSTDNTPSKLTAPTTFAPVVQKVMPSIVNVFSSRKVKTDSRSVELFGEDPVFRRF